MTLGNPIALALCLPIAAVAYLLVRSAHRAADRRAALAADHLLARQGARPNVRRWRFRTGLFVAAALLLMTALARPQIGSETQSVSGTGADILLIVDVSHSMAVNDVQWGRFGQTIYTAAAILDSASPLDRVGLSAFSEEGMIQCPLTTDVDVLTNRLTQIEPGMIGDGSSDLRQAISLALEQFPDGDHPGLAVIISDGEDHTGQLDDDALRSLRASGALVVAIGMGTETGGRVPSPQGRVFGDMNWRGRPAMSRLEDDRLKEMAAATGGLYIRADDKLPSEIAADVEPLRERVQRSLDPADRRRDRVPRELFQIPLALAVLLLLIDSLTDSLPQRWSARLRARPRSQEPLLIRRR